VTLTLEGRKKQMKKVTTIAAKTREEIQGRPQKARLRVCAYCRVSSDSSGQMESFNTQVAYYTGYINNRPEWELAEICRWWHFRHRQGAAHRVQQAAKGL